MSRFDTSPQSRLRNLASSLRLRESDVDEALAMSNGDVARATSHLRSLATSARQHQTGVKLTTEERIRKCAIALARTPEVLDILHASLTKVLQQPHSERLRKVSMQSGPFKEKVASKSPAAVELFYCIGYEPMHGHLVLQTHNPTVIRVALDELSAARSTAVYLERKAAKDSAEARARAERADAAAAAARRAAFLAKCPEEPVDDGASTACVITVRLPSSHWGAGHLAAGSEDAPRPDTRVGTRRFCSDNTLNDLVNYIKSLPAVPEDAPLTIENVTTRPPRLLDPSRQGDESLYSLDLYPVGQVQVSVSA